MATLSREGVIPVAEKLPPHDQHVWIVTEHFRCLGLLDVHGVWRNAYGDPIREVIGWLEFQR